MVSKSTVVPHIDDGLCYVFSVIKAEFATATVLITLGVILGKASPIQLFLMSVLEVFLYSINRGICEHILQAIDPGGAIYIHVFGAVFGLGVARMIFNPRSVAHEEEISSYHSDLFAMLGEFTLQVVCIIRHSLALLWF